MAPNVTFQDSTILAMNNIRRELILKLDTTFYYKNQYPVKIGSFAINCWLQTLPNGLSKMYYKSIGYHSSIACNSHSLLFTDNSCIYDSCKQCEQ